MIRMNSTMAAELQAIDWTGKTLPATLDALVAPGFCERDGLSLLRALSTIDTNAGAADFPDQTGHECFLNSIHIDDYVEADYLSHALLFVDECFARWRASGQPFLLNALVAGNEFGVVVKLHRLRNGESLINDDLEKYPDALLVADSSVERLSGRG